VHLQFIKVQETGSHALWRVPDGSLRVVVIMPPERPTERVQLREGVRA
jgi:predicted RNA binding protein YcfA (HicA-like mRNA interferase family)